MVRELWATSRMWGWPPGNTQQEVRALHHKAARKYILPTTWMSSGTDSSPVQPSEEKAAQPTPWLQPCEALSTGPSQAIPGLVAHGKWEIRDVYCFKPLSLRSFVGNNIKLTQRSLTTYSEVYCPLPNIQYRGLLTLSQYLNLGVYFSGTQWIRNIILKRHTHQEQTLYERDSLTLGKGAVISL